MTIGNAFLASIPALLVYFGVLIGLTLYLDPFFRDPFAIIPAIVIAIITSLFIWIKILDLLNPQRRNPYLR